MIGQFILLSRDKDWNVAKCSFLDLYFLHRSVNKGFLLLKYLMMKPVYYFQILQEIKPGESSHSF
jgi:hypothetical protein